MKLNITYLDSKNSGIKKKTGPGLNNEIIVLEKIFAAFLRKNLHFSHVKAVSVSITLCGRTKIQRLNREYRKKDYVTDVLSFPLYENLRDVRLPEVELGDIVICKEKARSQSRTFKITYEQEIIHLAVHGFLHLLGFDHEISLKEEKIMEQYEADLVKKIYKKCNY